MECFWTRFECSTYEKYKNENETMFNILRLIIDLNLNIFRLGQDFRVTRLLQGPVACNIFVKSVYYWSGFKLNLAYFIMMYLMVMSSINSKVKILRSISCKLSGFRCNPWYESGAKFIFWAIWKWIKLYFKHMMWEKCIGWYRKISGKGSQTFFYSFAFETFY